MKQFVFERSAAVLGLVGEMVSPHLRDETTKTGGIKSVGWEAFEIFGTLRLTVERVGVGASREERIVIYCVG